jgi:hypothetical protein
VVRSCSARDQHASGFSFHGFAREGHRLLLRSRTVTIWTSEGRLAQERFPEMVRVLHAQSPAAVSYDFLLPEIFLFVFSFVVRESFSLITPMAFGLCWL